MPPGEGVPGPQRRHLRRLAGVHTAQAIYFVTICTLDRRPVLASGPMAQMVHDTLQVASARHRWLVGHYVVMPDHIHLFCGPSGAAESLSTFIGDFKGRSSTQARRDGLEGRLWQREFFDHLLRSEESYEEKWHYVADNPVRAGLCATAAEWPYQGELAVL